MSATDRETDLKLYGDKTLRNQDLVLKIYAVHVTSQSLLSPVMALSSPKEGGVGRDQTVNLTVTTIRQERSISRHSF